MKRRLKYIRITLAALMLFGMTAMLLDTTGLVCHWMGWAADVQLLPALLSLNVVVVVAIVIVTLLVGRVYCSVICPMGIFQDVFSWAHRIIFPKRKYHYRRPANWLRYVVLTLFVVMMVAGLNSLAVLIAPYSAYGRMVTHIHGSGAAQVVAVVTVVVIGMMSFVWGRLWCNTLCPVGSLLSLLSRFSLFGVAIDEKKCVSCRRCEGACKAMCIDIDTKRVDMSRCVVCGNCLSECKLDAISIGRRQSSVSNPIASRQAEKAQAKGGEVDASRRRFMAGTLAVGTALVVDAQVQKVDGGLAAIAGREVPDRRVPVRPFGSQGAKNFTKRCTSCQLCVSQCPEHVLHPSARLEDFMQPEMVFSDGYCRLACTRCSKVCPAGAIQPLSREEKTSISVGRAITLTENCISARGEASCGTCARHCPAAAISMLTGSDGNARPVVNETRCIGCGACEYYCPARPMTAIFVEGREMHIEC